MVPYIITVSKAHNTLLIFEAFSQIAGNFGDVIVSVLCRTHLIVTIMSYTQRLVTFTSTSTSMLVGIFAFYFVVKM